MLEILALVILTLVLPVLVNKSTESHFEWVKPYLRPSWTAVVGFFSLYLLNRPEPMEVTMQLQERFRAHPMWGYVFAGATGALLLCVYWWFTGKVFSGRVAQPRGSIAIGTRPSDTGSAPIKNEPEPAYSVADIRVVCDDTSARIEVTNRGALALFSATLSIDGEVKPSHTAGLHCRWEGSNSEEINIAKGQMRRLIVADRRHYAPTTFPDKGITFVHHGAWWEMHALADGVPILVEGQSGPHASDIVLTIEIIANPDFKDGVKRSNITLTPTKAVESARELAGAIGNAVRPTAAEEKYWNARWAVETSDTSGRDEFIVLAGQLRHFLIARRADYDAEFSPGRFPTPYEQVLDMRESAMGETGKRARQKEAMKGKHNASTLQVFGDRFASRVLSADRRLRELGVNEATASHLGKYPSTIADVEAIVSELEAASAAALPSIRVPETAEERLWSLRYQAEAPELATKILTANIGSRVQTEALDVRLEGTFPGQLILHARGHACEIRISPIVLESAVVGTMKDGEQTRREVSERYSIEFPIVPDLRDGDKEVTPSLWCGEGYSRGLWPEKESKRKGMAEFLRMAEYIRRVEIGEPDGNTCTDAELNDFAERIRRPLTFSFEITFWNSDHAQQWKRSELLVHEPETGTAFVRHTGKPERLVAATGVRS